MKNKGLTLALITMIISGVSVFANAQLVKGMDPIVQTTIKNGLVGLLVMTWMMTQHTWSKLRSLTFPQWGKMFMIALVGGSLSFGLFFTGLKMTGAIDGSLIQKSMVVWIMVLALPLLKEKVSPWLAGTALALYGVNFIGGVGLKSIEFGHLLVLGATLLWSIEAIMVKKFITSIDTDLLLFGRMVLGSIVLMGYMLITGKAHLIATVSVTQWQGLLLVSLLLFGYVMTWYRALKYAPAVQVSSILVGATVITTALTSVSSGHLTLIQLIQSCVISGLVSGVIMVVQKPKQYQLPAVRSEI